MCAAAAAQAAIVATGLRAFSVVHGVGRAVLCPLSVRTRSRARAHKTGAFPHTVELERIFFKVVFSGCFFRGACLEGLAEPTPKELCTKELCLHE